MNVRLFGPVYDSGAIHVMPLKARWGQRDGTPSSERVEQSRPLVTACELEVLGANGSINMSAADIDPDGYSASLDVSSLPPGTYGVFGWVDFDGQRLSIADHVVIQPLGPPSSATKGGRPAMLSRAILPIVVALFGGLLLFCGDALAKDESDPRGDVVAFASDLPGSGPATATAIATGHVRRAAIRIFLRRQATKAALRGDRAKAQQLRKALDDDDVLDSVVDAIAADQSLSAPVIGDGAIIDQVIKFLQWLLDHADEIIALVMKILPIFVANSLPDVS